MNLNVISINYKTAPIEILEACSCNKDKISAYLSSCVGTIFFNEMVIISTCNRTEWVFISSDSNKAIDVLFNQIRDTTNISKNILKNHSEVLKGVDAITHLFQVTCGLKSMVLGENEILTQVKQNYATCMEFGATKAYLNKLFQLLISTGKDVRTVTGISKGAHSISSIAIEAIKAYDPSFIDKPMLLIGAGVMIQRALAKLSAMGHESLWVANRTMSRAQAIADGFPNTQVISYAAIKKELDRFATIYVGIHSTSPLFKEESFAYLSGRKTVVDVGIPRCVEPAVGDLDHIHLISIDQLESVANKTIKSRESVIPHVHACIRVALSEFNQWLSYRNESIEWVNKRVYG